MNSIIISDEILKANCEVAKATYERRRLMYGSSKMLTKEESRRIEKICDSPLDDEISKQFNFE